MEFGAAPIPRDGQPVRVLCISSTDSADPRRVMMENMFAEMGGFQLEFSAGIPSRDLRSKSSLVSEAQRCRLVDHPAGSALARATTDQDRRMFGRVLPESSITADVLWRSCGQLGRERAALACIFAHLIAARRAVRDGFDLIIEDNVRGVVGLDKSSLDTVDSCAAAVSIRQVARASPFAALRFYSWSGSIDNLREVISKKCQRDHVIPFPVSTENGWQPLIFGSQAYGLGVTGLWQLLVELRADIGSIAWRPKRARKSHVKPYDRLLPRKLLLPSVVGQKALEVVVAMPPAFFRAPMLPSKIHNCWDDRMAESVHEMINLLEDISWSSVWLSELDGTAVRHRQTAGRWLQGSFEDTETAEVTSKRSDTPVVAEPDSDSDDFVLDFDLPSDDLQSKHMRSELSGRLSIILVTSPVQSHPSTEMIDKIVASFDFVKNLSHCKMVIVADGAKVSSRYHPKKGLVTENILEGYDGFLDTIEARCRCAKEGIWSRTSIVRQQSRLGFGHAVKAGLLACDTEYCLVVQHDHAFAKTADVLLLDKVLDFMDGQKANYVNFPLTTAYRSINRAATKDNLDLRSRAVVTNDGTFIPIMFWYDSSHIGRRQSYLDLVFDGPSALPIGMFIEDYFGQILISNLRSDFDHWHRVYGNYCLSISSTSDVPLIYHLDGRRYFTDADRAEKSWSQNPSAYHSRTNRSSQINAT